MSQIHEHGMLLSEEAVEMKKNRYMNTEMA